MLPRISISKRLQLILNQIQQPCNVLADIGTDHAYLPIEACLTKKCETAIACDLHSGPLDNAKKNIIIANLETRIKTRLGNGLEPLVIGEADCIVISGMGGTQMCDIIGVALPIAQSANQVIFQPQRDYELLRRNLHAWGFEIFGEWMIFEEHYYQVISASFNKKNPPIAWTDKEYFLGKYFIKKLEEKDEEEIFLRKYVLQMRNKISGYIHSVKDKQTQIVLQKRIDWLTEVIGLE